MAKGGNPILRFFDYEHLPVALQAVSKPIADLARSYNESLPDGAEKSAGLRKLLEAKDCFVRAALPEKREQGCLTGAEALRDALAPIMEPISVAPPPPRCE